MTFRKIVVALLASFSISATGGFAVGKYSVSTKTVEGHTTYHLIDSSRKMDLGIVPDIGNFAYEFKVNGKDVFIRPESLKGYVERRAFCCGDPFLAPWANRIAPDYYFFQDKKYLLNPDLGNLIRDKFNQAIHGLVVFDPRFEVVRKGASETSGAFITSRLEFYKYPDLIAQFPFAHVIEVTYRLKDGKVENKTVITNVSRAAMPVMIAYHPYFRPDGDRNDWVVSNAAKNYWVLNDQLTPTGEKKSAEELMPNPQGHRLATGFLDNLFSDLERGPDGLAHVSVKGKTQKIEIVYGKEYDFAVIYAPLPPTGPLICIEPQTGPTNAFNLNHEGKYPGLPVLQAGKTFKATYLIVPTGF